MPIPSDRDKDDSIFLTLVLILVHLTILFPLGIPEQLGGTESREGEGGQGSTLSRPVCPEETRGPQLALFLHCEAATAAGTLAGGMNKHCWEVWVQQMATP